MRDDVMFRPVTPDNWTDFERLFEGKGGPKNCWCMVWRAVPKGAASERPAAAKKREMKRRVASGEPVGLLGYVDGAPVAWCSIAPRTAYRASMSDDMPGDDKQNIW